MSGKMVEYNILKREAEANKILYDGLLTKLREAGVSAGLRSSNIRIVDPAMVPSYPSRPAKARNVALAFVVGLVGGIGLALMREYMDNTVKTPDDIETLVAAAFLGGGAAIRAATNGNGDERKRQKLLPGFSSTATRSAWSWLPNICRSRKCPKRFARCELRCCFLAPIILRR